MPTPEQLLNSLKRQETRQGQGRLKIYLGMVAGVGKTYAMLKGAHQLKSQNIDVVVGYIETHGRLDTIAQIGDLEVLPRLKLQHRDVEMEEFDLDLALKRKPALVLVDELAHTNVPGSRHPKRYQDVLELLGRGIDVHTTLNVQHLQSRADTVAQVTGVIVQEIVPDSLIDRADDIIFIDQDPDEVIARLHQGKIYPPEKALAAAGNFFKEDNLTALREIGLRLMAERVDHELTEMKTLQGVPRGARPHHRLVVAVFASPFSEYLVRWTRRQAYALNCSWSAVYVRTSKVMSDEEEALLRKNLEAVRDLGGEVLEIQDDDIIQGILRGVREQEATQLVLGKPRERGWWWFWKKHITHSLIYGQTLVDVHVVSPPEHTLKNVRMPTKSGFVIQWPRPSAVGNSLLAVGVATLINLALLDYVAYHALGIVYMLTFCLAAIFLKHFSLMLAAGLSALFWNFVFIPPRFTFAITAGEDWLMLLMYLVTASVIGTFTRQLRRSESRLREQGERTEALYRMTRTLASARDASEAIHRSLEQLKTELDVEASVWVLEGKQRLEEARQQGGFQPNDKEWAALQWSFLNRHPAGRFTDTLPAVKGHYIPLMDQTGVWGMLAVDTTPMKELGTESLALVQAISQQLSFALGRDDLFRQLQTRQVREESEKIYKTLLNSVSHELRTPLTAIHGFADALASRGGDPQVTELAHEISENAGRLEQVVKNFLDMGRIEAGQLKLQKREVDVEELVRGVWARLKSQVQNRQVRLQFPSSPVVIPADGVLLAQAIENVFKNALTYTPQDAIIDVQLTSDGLQARLIIKDNGPGLGPEPAQVFEKFWRGTPGKTGGTGLGLSIAHAFVELHEGTLVAENVRTGGALFRFGLPLKEWT
jgi:two-component system sensor histidine kinase KdpD